MNKNILEIYKKRKYNEFLIEKRAKKEKVTNDFAKLAEDYNEKLLEKLTAEGRENLFDNYKVSYTPVSKVAQETLETIEKEFQDKMDDRNRLIEEIQSQIDICETYEQKLDIYKKYGVIDKHGKLYDYK